MHYHVLCADEVPDLYSLHIAPHENLVVFFIFFLTKITDRRVLETRHCASCLAVGRSTFKQT